MKLEYLKVDTVIYILIYFIYELFGRFIYNAVLSIKLFFFLY